MKQTEYQKIGDRESIGVVVSPSKIDEFEFALSQDSEIRAKEYCLIYHPIEKVPCLCRVITGSTQNPTMSSKGIGTILAKSGVEIGSEQEVTLMKAEVLGYIKNGSFRPMDFPVSPNSKVYKCNQSDVEPFFQSQEGIMLDVGSDPFSGIKIRLSLDWITKGHLGVYGQTRSGKTSFVMKLIQAGITNSPPARFVIHDRYGEYTPLLNFKDTYRIEYNKLMLLESLSSRKIAGILGFDIKSSGGKAVENAIRSLMEEERELTVENLAEKLEAQKLRSDVYARVKASLSGTEIENKLKRISENVYSKRRETILDLVEKYKVVIIDYSVDADIDNQQKAFTSIINQFFEKSVSTRGERYTCINVVEEAQFYAPERGMPTYGDPWRNGSLSALSMGVSQLGGYNIGFIIMTQRPAYVAKAVLAQCNTHICFRLMSEADHEQVSAVTGYSSWRLRQILPTLETHHGFLLGAASPFRFPVILRTDVWDYPKKAVKTASQVLDEMAKAR